MRKVAPFLGHPLFPVAWFRLAAVAMLVGGLGSCRRPQIVVEKPVPASYQDRTFHSPALGRIVTYRVRLATGVKPGDPVEVVYLLHGNGGSRREWSDSSRIAELAPAQWELVMPDGASSYFMNSATVPADRYEDFVTGDLIAAAERGLVVRGRAILGNSMGGFAAIVLAMKHPALYQFAGALSPPVDYPERAFTIRRLGQSSAIRSIFGPEGSATRLASDPFALARTANPQQVPYLWISCGDMEPLLEPVQRFDALLTRRGIEHAFRIEHGVHNWSQWNPVLTDIVRGIDPSVRRPT